MENEIKVGEYFRSENIGIMKYIYGTSYSGKHIYNLEYGNNQFMLLSFEGIKDMKHSSNLIDLIQCGDYVNGNKVLSIVPTLDNPNEIGLKFLGYDNLLYDVKIKTVVTKEQFESISYKVERKDKKC